MDPATPEPDLRALWQTQAELPLGLSAAQVRERARKLRTTIALRNIREWVGAAVVAVLFAVNAAGADSLAERIGCLLVVAGAAYVAWHLHAYGVARPLPANGLPCLPFYRHELARQRDLLRSVWTWYLGPLLPGLAVLTVDRLLAGPALPILGHLLVVLAILAGIGWLNRRVAREFQRQLDALPPDDSPT